jgi:hypothetical protein
MSKVWFGIIHTSSIDNNNELYDNLVFTPSNYSMIGKLRNGGEITIIKVLFSYDTPKSLYDIDYLSLKLHENLHNTFIPISLEQFNVFADVIKQLDYCESGIHPITLFDNGDPYNSEKDSDYVPSESDCSESSIDEDTDEEEVPEDEEDNEDSEEETEDE